MRDVLGKKNLPHLIAMYLDTVSDGLQNGPVVMSNNKDICTPPQRILIVLGLITAYLAYINLETVTNYRAHFCRSFSLWYLASNLSLHVG